MSGERYEHAFKAMEEALRMLSQESLGDFIYEIRDSELQGWDGPRVENWSRAVRIVAVALAEVDALSGETEGMVG